jgi:hypothetical protein
MSVAQSTHNRQVGRQAEEEIVSGTQRTNVVMKIAIESHVAEKDMTDDDIFDAEGRPETYI